MSELIDDILDNSMLEDYLNKESKEKYNELVTKIQNGETITVKAKPDYNHKSRRTFTRKLRCLRTQGQMQLCITTPVFKNYFLKLSEIVEILKM
jgi:hypothetical protein